MNSFLPNIRILNDVPKLNNYRDVLLQLSECLRLVKFNLLDQYLEDERKKGIKSDFRDFSRVPLYQDTEDLLNKIALHLEVDRFSWIDNQGNRVNGLNPKLKLAGANRFLFGDCSNLEGEISPLLWGSLNGLRGEINLNLTGCISPLLKGNVTGLYGDVSLLEGGISKDLIGNVTGVSGRINPKLTGDITGLIGVIDPQLTGDCTNLRGTVTGLTGDCTGLSGHLRLTGDCSNVTGDCTGIFGDCTNLSKDLSLIPWELRPYSLEVIYASDHDIAFTESDILEGLAYQKVLDMFKVENSESPRTLTIWVKPTYSPENTELVAGIRPLMEGEFYDLVDKLRGEFNVVTLFEDHAPPTYYKRNIEGYGLSWWIYPTRVSKITKAAMKRSFRQALELT